jgi:hypothetical protein
MRERLAQKLGGTLREHNRLMMAIWCLIHGTAMLIIRGNFEGALRAQALNACLDAVDNLLRIAASRSGFVEAGPKWPSSLILGEAEQSRLGNGNDDSRKPAKKKRR